MARAGVRFLTNSTGGKDFTANVFNEISKGATEANLASPFFTYAEPIYILRARGLKTIRLLIRLCSATDPEILSAIRKIPSVSVRYYTSRRFHAKVYLVGNYMLFGSANLTKAGMTDNRELSVLIERDEEDDEYDEVLAFFEELWEEAAVLTDDAMQKFALWMKTNQGAREQTEIDTLPKVSPPTGGAHGLTGRAQRTFLETYRRYYYEGVLPAHREVQDLYEQEGVRHPGFNGLSRKYEMDRFLTWAKLEHITDSQLENAQLRDGVERSTFIRQHFSKWLSAPPEIIDERVSKLSVIQEIGENPSLLDEMDLRQIATTLTACAAFTEQLRFTKGGLTNLLTAFVEENDLARVRRNLKNLATKSGDFVERTYDSIYDPSLRLRHFGYNCVIETFGWMNAEGIPPVNGRSIKALRYFGFPVREPGAKRLS